MSTMLKRLLLGVIILLAAYIGGAFSAGLKTFPYPQLLERPFQALEARRERSRMLESVFDGDLWAQARFPATGVVTDHPERSYGDYTFYTPSFGSRSLLIDRRGEVLHEWHRPFREVWADPPHIDRPSPESHIYWRRAELFPDGDVLVIYSTVADSPYGYGLVKFDRRSEVLWKYAAHTHHDFDVGPDGSIAAIVQRFRDTKKNPVAGAPQLPATIMEDDLVRLSADGVEQQRINLLDLLAESDYRWLLQMYAPGTVSPVVAKRAGDILHTNGVARIGEDFAHHHDFAEPGHLLLSFRSLDLLAIVDPAGPEITWASRGFWRHQHDPDPLANGHILLFDNRGSSAEGGKSRIVEYDPASHEVVWSWEGSRRSPFQSLVRGVQQRLPNDNVLITSSMSGRIFEVTRRGEIVWDFHNPMRRRHEGKSWTAPIVGAARFASDDLTFLSESDTADRP